MNASQWFDTENDPDRKRRKQAEFLIHGDVPIEAIIGIGTYNQSAELKVQQFLEEERVAIKTVVISKWFYLVKPDFSLLALKFDPESPDPRFKHEALNNLNEYKEGLTILRSVQCPYTEKNVHAILESAEKKFGLKTTLIDLKDAESAQNAPCAFGTFCILYNGAIISHHPISNTRFENIMAKALKNR